MNQRTRSIRARLSPVEHRKLSTMADRAGITQSEFIRFLISQESDVSRFEETIDEMKKALTSLPENTFEETPILAEVVWLLRELVADRNAQILSRVNMKLDQKFGERRNKL